jgi:hypothetical protein
MSCTISCEMTHKVLLLALASKDRNMLKHLCQAAEHTLKCLYQPLISHTRHGKIGER